jgi:polysaccharide biosynthesis protein PslL
MIQTPPTPPTSEVPGGARGRERNVTVDVAKGLGIFLVVLGHNSVFRLDLHPWYEGLYLFHVPLFFFLSGVTFKPAPFGRILRRRIRTLLVPYFAMGAVAVAASWLSAGTPSAAHAAAGVFYGTGHTLHFTPLWFLPCLFLVTLFAACIVKLAAGNEEIATPRARWMLASIAASCMAAGLWIIGSRRFATAPFVDEQGRPLGLPWSMDLTPVALAIFLVGVLCARSTVVWQHRRPLLLVTVALALLSAVAATHVSVDLNYRRVTDPLGAVIAMLTGITLIIGVSELVVRGGLFVRPIAHLGSASLVILIFHGPLQRRIVEWLASWALPPLATVVLGTGLTIALISIADGVLLRRVPALSWIYYSQQRWQS